jgi:hypothetical protein
MPLRVLFLLFSAILTLSLAQVSGQVQPTPLNRDWANTLWFHGIDHEGQHCPAGTVHVDSSPDLRSFVVTFSDLAARYGPDVPASENVIRDCVLSIYVSVPPGPHQAAIRVDFEGHIMLTDGMMAMHRTVYTDSLTEGRDAYGPLNQPYIFRDDKVLYVTGATRGVTTQIVTIQPGMILQGNPLDREARGYFSTERITVSLMS